MIRHNGKRLLDVIDNGAGAAQDVSAVTGSVGDGCAAESVAGISERERGDRAGGVDVDDGLGARLVVEHIRQRDGQGGEGSGGVKRDQNVVTGSGGYGDGLTRGGGEGLGVEATDGRGSVG